MSFFSNVGNKLKDVVFAGNREKKIKRQIRQQLSDVGGAVVDYGKKELTYQKDMGSELLRGHFGGAYDKFKDQSPIVQIHRKIFD